MESEKSQADKGVGESEFYKWRALFAVAHADNFLALEEQGMLYDYLDKVPFSERQRGVLREDMATPQDIEVMFRQITEAGDRDEFFELARKLVWVDGNLDEREKELVERLEALRDKEESDAAAEAKGKCGCPSGFFKGLIGKMTGKKGESK